ncbi:MAG: SCO2525 family SAM-dependent methyltransferase [Streptosporangiaceae bacterium]
MTFAEGVRLMSAENYSDHIWPDGSCLNENVEWNHLDPQLYCRKNYVTLHQDDLKFVAKIRDFMVEQLAGRDGLRGVDVGAGANLYPSLTMLPFCADLTLIDWSLSNIGWLDGEIEQYSPTWDPFWTVLAEDPAYASLGRPRRAFRERSRTHQGSVFELPADRWDIGTMFFVAESISSEMAEFRSAVTRFISALKPGAPFAVAFMENSEGWRVGDVVFPAVKVCEADIEASLKGEAEIHELFRLGAGIDRIRPGYTGMILACGKRKLST